MALEDRLTRDVIAIVADVAELSTKEVSIDASLEELGVDSLDGLRIVAAVEKRFGVVVDEAEIAKIQTMPDILDLVRRYAPEVE